VPTIVGVRREGRLLPDQANAQQVRLAARPTATGRKTPTADETPAARVLLAVLNSAVTPAQGVPGHGAPRAVRRALNGVPAHRVTARTIHMIRLNTTLSTMQVTIGK
jgi:hypothetical protein